MDLRKHYQLSATHAIFQRRRPNHRPDKIKNFNQFKPGHLWLVRDPLLDYSRWILAERIAKKLEKRILEGKYR